MDRDDVAVLDSKIMTNNTVESSGPIIEVVIGQHDQHSVLSLLALY